MPYHSFKDDEGNAYGSCEVFYSDDLECGGCDDCFHEGRTCHVLPAGWFWWACFPGCMPEGEPQGPYETEIEAINAAQES